MLAVDRRGVDVRANDRRFTAAILSNGRIVTGRSHGEAYGLLSREEQAALISGFVDGDGRFLREEAVKNRHKRLVFVRHGEVDFDDDPGITRRGRRQAHLVRRMLRGFDAEVFCSPARRCVDTARAMVGHEARVSSSLSPKMPNESAERFDFRLGAALDALPEDAIVVTHSDVIQQVSLLLFGHRPDSVPYCGVTAVVRMRPICVAVPPIDFLRSRGEL